MNPTTTDQPEVMEESGTRRTKKNSVSKFLTRQWSKVKRKQTPSLGRMCSCSVGLRSKVHSESNLYAPLPIEKNMKCKKASVGVDASCKMEKNHMHENVNIISEIKAPESSTDHNLCEDPSPSSKVSNENHEVYTESLLFSDNECTEGFATSEEAVDDIIAIQLPNIDKNLCKDRNNTNNFDGDGNLILNNVPNSHNEEDEHQTSCEIFFQIRQVEENPLLSPNSPADDTGEHINLNEFVEDMVSEIAIDAKIEESDKNDPNFYNARSDSFFESNSNNDILIEATPFKISDANIYQPIDDAICETTSIRKIQLEEKLVEECTAENKFLEADLTPEINEKSYCESLSIDRCTNLKCFHIFSGQPGMKHNFFRTVMQDCIKLEEAQIDTKRGLLTGIVRVRSFGYEKIISVRISFDNWKSFCDVFADYIQDSHDRDTDKFSFRILFPSTLTPGDVVYFAIRYQTHTGGVFWDNNGYENYSVSCSNEETKTGTQ